MKVNLTNNASRFTDGLQSRVPIALEAVGLAAERYAKLNAPVDTGTLRNSISHDVSESAVMVGTDVEYAPFVEFGTGVHAANGGGTLVVFDKNGEPHKFNGQRPQPFLKPAIADHMDEYMQIIEKKLMGG